MKIATRGGATSCVGVRTRYASRVSCSVAHLPLAIPLTAVEHMVVTEALDAVHATRERLRALRGELYDEAKDAPRVTTGDAPTLEIPRAALAIVVAVLLDADARWGPNRVRGLVFDLVERIDAAARNARWL